jgi:hypothetical protein
MDWVLLTDELVALAKTATPEDHNAAPPRWLIAAKKTALHRDYANSRFISS